MPVLLVGTTCLTWLACLLLGWVACAVRRFGEALEPAEQEWLVWEINQHITGLRGAAPRADDMPPEDVPEARMEWIRW